MFAISAFGCNKNISAGLRKELSDEWELSKIYFFRGSIDYAPGNGNLLQFGTDGRYKRTVNNIDTSYAIESTYRLQQTDACGINLVLDITSNSSERWNESVSNDTLYLKTNSCMSADGGNCLYVRVR